MAKRIIRKKRPVEIGERFVRLQAIRDTGVINGSHRFECLCDCGAITVVVAAHLRNGNTKSCGCLKNEMAATINLRHGLTHTSEYHIWHDMKRRCRDPRTKAFVNYGARGITVCERWNSFEAFYQDMGPRPTPKHTIERKDNDAGYAPENCVWATRKEQCNNSRHNRIITFNGKSMTLAQAIESSGISPNTVRRRVDNGWPQSLWFIAPLAR